MVSFRGQKKLGPLPDRSPTYVIHMCSTFAPSLTAGIIFRRVGFHDRYRKRVLHLLIEEKKKNWSRFRVVLTKEMQGGNRL